MCFDKKDKNNKTIDKEFFKIKQELAHVVVVCDLTKR